jgi:hypothetical protein
MTPEERLGELEQEKSVLREQLAQGHELIAQLQQRLQSPAAAKVIETSSIDHVAEFEQAQLPALKLLPQVERSRKERGMLGDAERELRWNLTQAQEDLLAQFARAQQLQKRVEVLEETLEQISVIASTQGKEHPSAAINEIRTLVDDLMPTKGT